MKIHNNLKREGRKMENKNPIVTIEMENGKQIKVVASLKV